MRKLCPRLVLAVCSSQQRLVMGTKWPSLSSPAQAGRGRAGATLVGGSLVTSPLRGRKHLPPLWWGRRGPPIPASMNPSPSCATSARKELCTPCPQARGSLQGSPWSPPHRGMPEPTPSPTQAQHTITRTPPRPQHLPALGCAFSR